MLHVTKRCTFLIDWSSNTVTVGIVYHEIIMPTDENTTENFEKETIERLIAEKQSESISVSPSGTTTAVTNHSVDQVIKGLEYLRKTTQINPFNAIGFGRSVMPTAID